MKYPEQESSLIELKQELPKNDQIIKTVVAFCNRNGGKIVIGVANNGNIAGVEENVAEQIMEYLDKTIYETTSPPILPLIYSRRIGDKTILFIEVSTGMNKPYYHRKEGLENGTYIRLGRSTIRATAEMIEELKWQSRGKTFETLAVYHAKISDLSEQALIYFFTKTRKKLHKVTISENLLLSYPLLIKEHSTTYPNVAGVLLFSHKPQQFFSEAMIICSHFSGIVERKALATLDCTGTLFEQFDAAYDFILSRLNRSFIIKGKRRHEELEVPEEAIREVLLNAIIHRNYHINGPIKIAIYENRIEIFSPGSFPGPIDPNNLMLGVTYLRNLIICRAFRESGLVEKLGSGWLTLFNSYKKLGLEEPQIIEGVNFVKCVLPRRTTRTKIILEEDDLQAIIKLFETVKEISIVDVMKILNLSRATTGRRLAELQQKKRIKKIGAGKNTRYVLM